MTDFEIVFRDPAYVENLMKKGDRAVNKTMDKIAMQLIGELSKRAPVDTGQLAAEGNWKAVEVSGYGRKVYSLKDYASAVWKGSKPHSAPFGPISLWAERHNMDPHALWWHIYQKGTAGNPFVERAMVRMEGPFDIYLTESLAKEGVI